ncbi:MAG: MBL fold metallo-hydrolase [Candidatus Levybacteria bacterium]|nr:MBL fold metallo-hydrolase [Candidatus Levybacteria bacterium]
MRLTLFTIVIPAFFLFFGIYTYFSFYDSKLHVTICDVGQGDGIVIRTPRGHVIVFDGGPDQSILRCLDSSLPFWQKSIDIVLLSHPHADHLNGLVDVFAHYAVKKFATEAVGNTSYGYKALQNEVEKEGISWELLEIGDIVKTDDEVTFTIIGPSEEFVKKTVAGGLVLSSGEVPTLEVLVSYGDFDLLLTGDSQHQELKEAISAYQHLFDGHSGRRSIEVLQVPHHGSRTGLTKALVAWLHPTIATISSGKGNSYGHPASEIVKTLREHGVEVHRTDTEGNLRLVTDGKTYNLQ